MDKDKWRWPTRRERGDEVPSIAPTISEAVLGTMQSQLGVDPETIATSTIAGLFAFAARVGLTPEDIGELMRSVGSIAVKDESNWYGAEALEETGTGVN